MLPNKYKPQVKTDLIRLGRDFDGGYVVAQRSINEADALISMGVNDDWSFEKQFIKLNSIPVNAYDHTVTPKFWRNYVLGSFYQALIPTKARLRRFVLDFLVFIDYNRFFKKDVIHFRQKIGLNKNGDISVKDVISKFPDDFNIFFKIDIEGGEYRILDELIDYQDRLSGLAIELHDCDLHKDKILAFLSKFKLSVANIHPNNFAGVDINDDPLVVEMTFFNPTTDEMNDKSSVSFPCELDEPCNGFADELQLKFES